MSVSGGIDSSAPYPGLVRIKRLFPHQAAWATGKLQPGDILLEANGIILTGLTNNVRTYIIQAFLLSECFEQEKISPTSEKGETFLFCMKIIRKLFFPEANFLLHVESTASRVRININLCRVHNFLS